MKVLVTIWLWGALSCSALAQVNRTVNPAEAPLYSELSIDQAVRAILFSLPYWPWNSKVRAGVPPTADTARQIREFADGRGEFAGIQNPPEERLILLETFNFSDPEIIAALKHAKEKGVHVIQIVADDRRDFDPLVQHGFEPGNDRHGFAFPQPEKTTNRMRPIVLAKAAAFGVRGEPKRTLIQALSAWLPIPRFLRSLIFRPNPFDGAAQNTEGERWVTSISTANLVVVNPGDLVINSAIQFSGDFAEMNHAVAAMRETYRGLREGKGVRDLPMASPTEVHLSDGSVITFSSTGSSKNGDRFNPNDGIVDFLTEAKKNAVRIETIHLFHYAFCHNGVAKVLAQLSKGRNPPKILAVLSTQFADR